MTKTCHALVTGGGSGIGEAVALALAEKGHRVTIAGRREQALASVAAKSGNIQPAVMDVTSEESVVAATAQAVERSGPVQIMVANAGIAEGLPFHKTDLAHWRMIMLTNLDGAYLTIREALKSMRPTGWGRVIAMASIAGVRGLRNASAYTASKHGLVGLARVLAEELVGEGITVNAICPAYVDTPIIERNMVLISEKAGISKEQALGAMVSANKHGRLIAPEEVAGTAAWLCEESSGSVNGQVIEIAGGQA